MIQLYYRKIFLVILSIATAAGAYAQPHANFTANYTSGCAPLVVQFTNLSTGATTYHWDFGNNNTSVLANPATTYTQPGTYTVTLIAYNGPNSDTKVITNYITVHNNPTVDFSGSPLSGCPGLTVNFTNNSNPQVPGPATYYWDFGDGYFSTSQNPSHNYTTPGYYNVTLSVTNAQGCISSLVKPNYVHVFTPPNVHFTANTTVFCSLPATATFTNTTTGTGPLTYLWDFGDLTTDNTANPPPHTYNNTGTYTVTLSVTDANGCTGSYSVNNFISVQQYNGSFTGTTSICLGTIASFTNTSPAPITSTTWDFGDNTTGAGTPVNHLYTTAGTYTVKLITQSGACFDTVTNTIVVHPMPDTAFTYTPVAPCPPPATIQFNNQTVNGNTYLWNFGDNTTSTAVNPSHTYTAQGPYDVTLIATSQYGCTDTLKKKQYINLHSFKLYAYSDKTGGCAPVTVQFMDSVDYYQPIVSWTWDFGDNTTSNLPSPTHTYNVVGVYTVVLTCVSANGCVQHDTLEIGAGTPPTANFTAAPTTVCINEGVHFTNLSTNATDYLWYFGDGTDTSSNPTHIYNNDGVFTVTLIAYNNGCPDTMTMPNLVTVHPPVSGFGINYSCDTPTKVSFVNTSHGYTSFLWEFGDNTTTATDTSPVHIYPSLGTYIVTLVTYNSVYGCSDSTMIQIELLQPVVNFTATDTAICKNDTAYFNSTVTGGSVGAYAWTMDNHVFPDTTASFKYKFTDTGLYTIKLSAIDPHGCPRSATKNNYILVAKPSAGFEGVPPYGCVPLDVLFTDTSHDVTGAFDVTREWDFGNGNATVITASTNHTYNAAGTYSVKLIVTDNVGCKDSLLKTNYIKAYKPNAAFVSNTLYPCIGDTARFTNGSTGATVLTAFWDFGDNTTSNVYSAKHVYTQAGNYTVTLVVTDTVGCKDTATINVSVTKPTASFTMNDSTAVCPPLQVLFTSTSQNATTYHWDFGNNNTAIISNPATLYTAAGDYLVQLIAINSHGCRDTAYQHVKLLGYAGAFTYAPLLGCAPMQVNFTANVSNVPSLTWDYSDGTISAASPATTSSHVYTQPGAYIPKLILSDSTGCQTSSLGLDTIKVDGFSTGYTFQPNPACEKTTTQFLDTSYSYFSPVTNWYWLFDDGQSSTVNNPSHYYDTPGDHQVLLAVTNGNGCVDTLRDYITIYPLPVITASADTIICLGDAAQLQGYGGISYTWAPPVNLGCANCQTTSAAPGSPTWYVVTGTDAHGCMNTDSVKVSIKTKTSGSAGQGGEICDDNSIQLHATGGNIYTWSPTEHLDDSHIADPTASPHLTTNFTVVIKEASCLPDTQHVKVIVHPKPSLYAGEDRSIVAGNSTQLKAVMADAVSYEWSADPTLSCTDCYNPVATPIVTTTYTLSGVSDWGCHDSDKVTITVLCDQSQAFIPNSFTPNGDGQNDVFYPRGTGIIKVKTFRVYDRWGELLFERKGIDINDEQNGWDGTYKGNVLSPDVYVYVMEVICQTGEQINLKGDITIIR